MQTFFIARGKEGIGLLFLTHNPRRASSAVGITCNCACKTLSDPQRKNYSTGQRLGATPRGGRLTSLILLRRLCLPPQVTSHFLPLARIPSGPCLHVHSFLYHVTLPQPAFHLTPIPPNIRGAQLEPHEENNWTQWKTRSSCDRLEGGTVGHDATLVHFNNMLVIILVNITQQRSSGSFYWYESRVIDITRA